jgi:hypothetical protein
MEFGKAETSFGRAIDMHGERVIAPLPISPGETGKPCWRPAIASKFSPFPGGYGFQRPGNARGGLARLLRAFLHQTIAGSPVFERADIPRRVSLSGHLPLRVGQRN